MGMVSDVRVPSPLGKGLLTRILDFGAFSGPSDKRILSKFLSTKFRKKLLSCWVFRAVGLGLQHRPPWSIRS